MGWVTNFTSGGPHGGDPTAALSCFVETKVERVATDAPVSTKTPVRGSEPVMVRGLRP